MNSSSCKVDRIPNDDTSTQTAGGLPYIFGQPAHRGILEGQGFTTKNVRIINIRGFVTYMAYGAYPWIGRLEMSISNGTVGCWRHSLIITD